MKFLIQIDDSTNSDFLQEKYRNHSAKHKDDSGLDLFIPEDTIIYPGETKLVDLGIKCQLRSIEPCIWKWLKNKSVYRYHSYNMYPRSSISKTQLLLANSVGLCDAGYLGNLKAALYNKSDNLCHLKQGERYVQLSRSDLGTIKFEIVESLRSSERGTGGFGSTGR
jgi:dUTP pyrophosphatase